MPNFCHQCGKPLQKEWNVCPYCSQPVYKDQAKTGEIVNIYTIPKSQSTQPIIATYKSSLPYEKDLELEEPRKLKLTSKQKKTLVIGVVVILASILIPVISVLVYDYLNPYRNVYFYVNNGWDSRSYTVRTRRDKLDYYNNLPHPPHAFSDPYYMASIIESYCTPDDTKILQIAQAIRGKCIDSYSSEEVINALLSFTQAIGYKSDVLDIANYPLETIFKQGDCEDLSILFGSLVVSLGYNAVIIIIDLYDEGEEEWVGHACVGVYLPYTPTAPSSSWYFDIGDNKYWICETTYQGWLMGDLPVSDSGYYLMEGYAYIS